MIYGSRTSKPSGRIEHWVLRLQPYSFNVIYKSGADNPADYLSRHSTSVSRKQEKTTEEYINFIVRNSVSKAMTLDEISQATDQDRVLNPLPPGVATSSFVSAIFRNT